MRTGVNYNQMYAQVAAWEYIRILISTVLRNKLKTMQLESVLDFTQATVES